MNLKTIFLAIEVKGYLANKQIIASSFNKTSLLKHLIDKGYTQVYKYRGTRWRISSDGTTCNLLEVPFIE